MPGDLRLDKMSVYIQVTYLYNLKRSFQIKLLALSLIILSGHPRLLIKCLKLLVHKPLDTEIL